MEQKKVYLLKYESIDGVHKHRTFKTKKGALKFINDWVGESREISDAFNYVVSHDGVGKVIGKNCRIRDLLESATPEPEAPCPVCESHLYPDDHGVTYGSRDEMVSVTEFKCTCGKKAIRDHEEYVDRQTFFHCCDGCEIAFFDWDTNTPCSSTCDDFSKSLEFFKRNPEQFKMFLEWNRAREKEIDKDLPF